MSEWEGDRNEQAQKTLCKGTHRHPDIRPPGMCGVQEMRVRRLPRRLEDHCRSTDAVRPTPCVGASQFSPSADIGSCGVFNGSGQYGIRAFYGGVGRTRSCGRDASRKLHQPKLCGPISGTRHALVLRAMDLEVRPDQLHLLAKADHSEVTWSRCGCV
jgi:hypothetical protein